MNYYLKLTNVSLWLQTESVACSKSLRKSRTAASLIWKGLSPTHCRHLLWTLGIFIIPSTQFRGKMSPAICFVACGAAFSAYFGSALHSLTSLCECDLTHRESQIVANVFVTLVACELNLETLSGKHASKAPHAQGPIFVCKGLPLYPGTVVLSRPNPNEFMFNLSLMFFFLNLLAGRKSVFQCLSQMPCDLRFAATLFRLGVLGWAVICLKRNFRFHFISVAFSCSPETKLQGMTCAETRI